MIRQISIRSKPPELEVWGQDVLSDIETGFVDLLLIVDDKAVNRAIILEVLKPLGFDCHDADLASVMAKVQQVTMKLYI